MRRSLRVLARRLSALGGSQPCDAAAAGGPVGGGGSFCGTPAALAAGAVGPSVASSAASVPPLHPVRRFFRASRATAASSVSSHPHAPADELAAGAHSLGAAAAASPKLEEQLLEEALVEDDLGDEGLELAPAPTGPGSEFIRTDPLATLALGESLQAAAKFHGRPWQFETGRMARISDGACTLRVGATTLLATAVSSTQFNPRRDPLAPLFEVEYRERAFAVGRIPTGYNKREGGPPKEQEVLAGRRVDRALRPLFPKGFVFDTQITSSVLSADGSQDLDVAAINAASAALLCSDIPWGGPVAAARVTLDAEGHLHVNAPQEQQEVGAAGAPRLRLLLAVTAQRIVMLEAEGAEVPEKEFVRALRHGVHEARKLLQPQLELAAKAGRAKRTVQLAGADHAAALKVEALAGLRVEGILRNAAMDKASRARALQQAKADILQLIRDSGSFRFEAVRTPGSGCVSPSDLDHTFTALLMKALRKMALEEGLRADGRGLIDCRELHCELDTVPVVHGSALFTRGETQSLCTVTVGGRGDEQRTESLLDGEGAKRLAVHYAFPAFAINETTVNGQRRVQGHSSLAERALLPVLPPEADFPFPLRLNADTLASNGSSSLAAVCGGALALWDAGVPITSLVAGVSVGMFGEQCWDGITRSAGGEAAGVPAAWPPLGRYELLTDLMGLEDTLGDMDFKVAGSRAGITAVQLDVKLAGGVPEDVLIEALERARLGRLSILHTMESALPKERPLQAPTFGVVRVSPSALGRVIGTMGSKIKEICAATGARLDVAPDGCGDVRIYGPSRHQYEEARARVLQLAGEDIQEGQTYSVKVSRLVDFGAFVEFPTGVRALLHISEVAPTKIRSMEDVLAVGDSLDVLCMGRDPKGNIRISRKALLLAQHEGQQQ